MYYINLGRWANNIIGPFDEYVEADAYIDDIPYRGNRPTVVGIAPPIREVEYEVTGTRNGLTFTTTVLALNGRTAIGLVEAGIGRCGRIDAQPKSVADEIRRG